MNGVKWKKGKERFSGSLLEQLAGFRIITLKYGQDSDSPSITVSFHLFPP